MDTLTPSSRSWNMSRIRGSDTMPERVVRSFLHKEGFRFRLHAKRLPGTPDIVLPKYRCVVLVHGCFWHRHRGCQYAYTPKSRQAFWLSKFKANKARDLRVLRALRTLGWRVIIVWECETKSLHSLKQRVLPLLKHSSPRLGDRAEVIDDSYRSPRYR